MAMNNAVLEDIRKYVASRLQAAYGFVGIAVGPEMAMLNSTDDNGNDVIIKIEVKKEDSHG